MRLFNSKSRISLDKQSSIQKTYHDISNCNTPQHINYEQNNNNSIKIMNQFLNSVSINNKDKLKSSKNIKRYQQNHSCSNKLCKHYTDKNQKEIIIQNLCVPCQIQFQNQSYCVYCRQIYFDNTDDGKQWIMCQECQKWVHSQCADFNTKQNFNVMFKCFKCKIKDTIRIGNSKKTLKNNAPQKIQKKKNNQFLIINGFNWQLNDQQIYQDMENIKKYLSIK